MTMKYLSYLALCTAFLLAACGGKATSNNDRADADEEETTVVSDDMDDADEEDYDTADATADDSAKGIPAISRVWERQPISVGAEGRKVTIGMLADAFCRKYKSRYEPNQVLHDYLSDPAAFPQLDEAKHFAVDDQSANGYLSCQLMTEYDLLTTCCYWNRSNGHKLVAFWLSKTNEGDDAGEHLAAFYDYDPATDTMTPEPALTKTISDAMASYDDYSVTLPSQGKDIRLCGYSIDLENDSAENTYYIMRWNGNGFRLDQMREEDW